MGTNTAFADPDYIDDLQLLSTSHNPIGRQTADELRRYERGRRSCSSVFAATVWEKDPALTPETVRALMISSAEWTRAMPRALDAQGDVDYKNLVRCFGYGVPRLRRLLSVWITLSRSLAESNIQPFFKEDDH